MDLKFEMVSAYVDLAVGDVVRVDYELPSDDPKAWSEVTEYLQHHVSCTATFTTKKRSFFKMMDVDRLHPVSADLWKEQGE